MKKKEKKYAKLNKNKMIHNLLTNPRFKANITVGNDVYFCLISF